MHHIDKRSKRSFATWFASDDYLPGVLALYSSLKWFHPDYEFITVLTNKISEQTIETLKSAGCIIKLVDEIAHPEEKEEEFELFNHYTKLRVFGLVEYEKIVFLDADLIICDNIESLFDMPHMSAVVSGGLIKEQGWVDLNGGLLVLEPSIELFQKMLSQALFLPSKDGTDQGFLQSYYPNWKFNQELHLPHAYNVPVSYLDTYCDDFDFHFSYINGVLVTNIKILHYWGPEKPWLQNISSPSLGAKPRYLEAVNLWYDYYLLMLQDIKIAGR